MRTMRPPVLVTLAAVGLGLTACGSGGTPESGSTEPAADTTITVAYQKTDSMTQLDALLQKSKAEFEEANPGMTIELQPINAQEDGYFTKLALMNGSPETAPDVIYEDTFQVRADAAAGFLAPMDEYLDDWEDWDQFADGAKEAGLGDDGKTYGISMGTDTRGIYFNKQIFEQAGLPADWQPTTWADVLDAARTVKEAVPGVIPLNIFGSKAQGEATSMQGFEMLLYGTEDSLYDPETAKWITGSQGFVDALGVYDTIAKEGLGPDLQDALDPNLPNRVSDELLPQGKLAIAVNGSWVPGGWIAGGVPWPEWEDVMGLAKMPTQDGQEPGATSMSGGWLLSVGAHADDPEAAFNFIAHTLNRENSFEYDTEASQIAVRKDVATDPEYLAFNPTFEFFSSLVDVTHFRPATPDYSQISSNIQVATESVITGQATPEDAALTYDEALTQIVGDDGVQASD